MDEAGMIDDSYESLQAVVDGLDVNGDILEEYDEFDDSTELLNFLEEEIVLQEGDINRVLEQYENPKCHKCLDRLGDVSVNEVYDPTLATDSWVTEDNSYRQGDEDRFTNVVLGYCVEHDEVFVEYEETFYD